MGEIDGRLKVAGGDRGNQARSRRRSSVHGDDGMVRGKGKEEGEAEGKKMAPVAS